MVNVTVTTGGTSGPRGNGWLNGTGAPSNSVGFDGDYYLDNGTPGLYFGPKANGVWPGSKSFTQGASVFTSTGLISGAVMTKTSATSFSVTAGAGLIADWTTNPANPTFTAVTIPAQTITLSAAEQARVVSWWVSDANGVITSLATNPTPSQRRTSIQLGYTAFLGGTITDAVNIPVYLPQESNQRFDLGAALGPFRSAGALVTPNGANLSFNLSAGTMFSISANYMVDPQNPDLVTTLAETPCSFYQTTQVANSETAATVIDPTHYDVGGTITPVGGGTGSSTVQRVWLFPTRTAGSQIAIQYGQTVYNTLNAAVASVGTNVNYVINPDFARGNGALIGWIVTTRVCTSLQDTANAALITAGKFDTP